MKSVRRCGFVVFATLAMAASFVSSAIAAFDPKACYARCMEEINDHRKCDRICDPSKK